MRRSYISPRLAVPVWSAFRRRCHRFLAIGYERALPHIKNDPDEETDIMGYICQALEKWFRANPRDSFLFFIKENPPLGGTGRTGKRRLRTDIIMSYAAGSRPQFFFEAKRLHRTKATASRYIGEAGMGCFISGRYAGNCGEAAMIGYVQPDTLEHWQRNLQSTVESRRAELSLQAMEKSAPFRDSFPLEWSSSHGRTALNTLTLFHILLDCRK